MQCSSNVAPIRKTQTSPQAAKRLEINWWNYLSANKGLQLATDFQTAAKVRRSASRNGHAAHTEKRTLIKGKEEDEPQRKKEKTEGERQRERRHHTSDSSSFVTPLVMLPSVVYLEKIPLMSQLHHTADPVHEWHLSEPRVSPMIRGNSPKGLCSWEKCLLQRGMQNIPGSTGPPLLAGWRYSGANKGTKMGS